ncbi:MAG: hypothetical protein KC776_20310 [Myxococcales bacterium]|nr:hypothetical protein [Myxococcales bacterium]MCB9577999.1 hypothetical protein [Polyangiaceae bacterium]
MKLKRSPGNRSISARLVRAGLAGLTAVAAISGLATGCLDRPVSPASPNTTNVFVDQIRQQSVDKIDLLFMIDNSISMADKQAILADAVPELAKRLVTPICVDATDHTTPTGQYATPDCPGGSEPEFKPIRDIHIGVISSSLGGHGGDVCEGGAEGQNDRARLIASVRGGIPSYNGLGFLWWDPDGKGNPPGQNNDSALFNDFSANVKGPGEQGCGYEASLESWYRFLVDPQPPGAVAKDPTTGLTTVSTCDPAAEGQDCDPGNGQPGICTGGICADKTLLEQRQNFLRGDSLVAVIMLSDENDCSIRDDGQAWLVSTSGSPVPRATSACNSNPDDPCCFSCGQLAPQGCTPTDQDVECQKGAYDQNTEDTPNLRCWEQKRRFGVDWLYPIKRYIDGLTQQRIFNRTGQEVPNPLFANSSGTSRDPSLIFLAGIVGVPWQLISDAASQSDPNTLNYLNAGDIDWSKIIHSGSPGPGVSGYGPPGDPHMIESVVPRANLPDPNSAPGADPYSGHEWLPANDDLQYACIFPLEQPRNCQGATGGCDCKTGGDPGYALNNPLCQDTGGGYSYTQRLAKAYPGLRQLEVLHDFGENSIVASICPKNTSDKTAASYGYNPAVGAIIERLKEALNVKCVNRPIAVNVNPDTGETETQCAVVEVSATQNGACNCDGNANRGPVDPKLVSPVFKQLAALGQCGPGSASGIPCDAVNFCQCEINEASNKQSCENDPDGATQGIGWCYIDAELGIGNPALVSQCNPPRQLRFVGNDTPASGATVFIACLGKILTGDAGS